MITHDFRKFYGSIKEAAEAPETIFQKRGGACRPARPGEQGCFLQKQQPSRGIFWRAQVGLVAICTPFLLNAPPFLFFCNSFSVMLRNFTNFVAIPIFLPQGYESLRIT